MESIIQHLQESTYNESEYHYTSYGQDEDDYNDYEPYDQDINNDNSNYTHIVNTILNVTARLNVLFPTTIILAFTTFARLITNNNAKCTTSGRWLMGGFMAFLATWCVFISVTDSFRTVTGRFYYGVATFHGIRTFGGGRARPSSDYRLRWGDMFRASLSLIVFLAFALLQNDVLSCYQMVLPRKLINLGPLVVGFVISLLFILFPSSRRGIGYPFLLAAQ